MILGMGRKLRVEGGSVSIYLIFERNEAARRNKLKAVGHQYSGQDLVDNNVKCEESQ